MSSTCTAEPIRAGDWGPKTARMLVGLSGSATSPCNQMRIVPTRTELLRWAIGAIPTPISMKRRGSLTWIRGCWEQDRRAKLRSLT